MRDHFRSTLFWVAAALVIASLAWFTLPAASEGPLDDLTYEPCFGASDPFCPPEEDDGGGGQGGACYNCTLDVESVLFECKSGGTNSDECSIVYDSQGRRSCQYTGDPRASP